MFIMPAHRANTDREQYHIYRGEGIKKQSEKNDSVNSKLLVLLVNAF